MSLKFMAACAALVCGYAATAQNTSAVPKAVKSSFRKAYAGVTKVKWENEKGKYEASFHYHNHDLSVLYTADGVMTETETKIVIDALPKTARDYASARGKIKEAARIVKASGEQQYEAEVNGRDLIFDSKGAIIAEKRD